MNLNLLQQGLIRQIYGLDMAEDFINHLQPLNQLQPIEQLTIYQNNCGNTLHKTLRLIYPVCLTILGENYFKQITHLYIEKHPSVHHDLNFYGDCFADFLKSQSTQRMELNDFRYLADLAQLEWLHHQVYYSAENDKFDVSAFSQLKESEQAQCCLKLASDIRFMRSNYPIVSIWRLNQNDSNQQITLNADSESCCIYKNNNQVKITKIDQNSYTLLAMISSGARLNEISAIDSHNNLANLISYDWVNGFEVLHV